MMTILKSPASSEQKKLGMLSCLRQELGCTNSFLPSVLRNLNDYVIRKVFVMQGNSYVVKEAVSFRQVNSLVKKIINARPPSFWSRFVAFIRKLFSPKSRPTPSFSGEVDPIRSKESTAAERGRLDQRSSEARVQPKGQKPLRKNS